MPAVKEAQTTSSSGWTPTEAYLGAALCLLLGLVVGYLFSGSAGSRPPAAATAPVAPASPGGAQAGPASMKDALDRNLAPMLQRLQAEPNNADLLASIGDVYFDAQLFQDSISYYERSLKIRPGNTAARTDMGTAYWYLGDADRAIAEFQTVLQAEPTKANTLFNLGIVEWQGKGDAGAAVAAWNKLLAANPDYPNRGKVQEMIDQAKRHSGIKPGTKTGKPATP